MSGTAAVGSPPGNGHRLGVVDDAHTGTPLATWRAWEGWSGLPVLDPTRWRRVVAVAPHPDDEVLGVGALLGRLAGAGHAVSVVAVTDGDGADPDADAATRADLADRRVHESLLAGALLGLPVAQRLRLPDGHVADHEAVLVEQLAARLGPGTVCLATWDGDGHPDHEAVGRAALAAGRRTGAVVVHFPVWAWHWAEPGDPAVPWHRAAVAPLTDGERAAKRAAVACFVSQVTAPAGRSPVLPPAVVDRLVTDRETLFLAHDPSPEGR